MPQNRARRIARLCGDRFLSPSAIGRATAIAAQIDDQDCCAHQDGGDYYDPLREVGVDHGIEETEEKGATGGFDIGARFEPIFRDGQRAGRPGGGLDEDGVNERGDVKVAKNGPAARDGPTEEYPAAPKEVQKEHQCDEKGQGNNWMVTSPESTWL